MILKQRRAYLRTITVCTVLDKIRLIFYQKDAVFKAIAVLVNSGLNSISHSPPRGSTLSVWSSVIHLSTVSSSMLNGLSLYSQPGLNRSGVLRLLQAIFLAFFFLRRFSSSRSDSESELEELELELLLCSSPSDSWYFIQAYSLPT